LPNLLELRTWLISRIKNRLRCETGRNIAQARSRANPFLTSYSLKMAFFIGFEATTVAMPSFTATLQVSICRANKRLNHWSVTSRGARGLRAGAGKMRRSLRCPAAPPRRKIFLFFLKRARAMVLRGLIQRQNAQMPVRPVSAINAA
jgi:hypothetical protein